LDKGELEQVSVMEKKGLERLFGIFKWQVQNIAGTHNRLIIGMIELSFRRENVWIKYRWNKGQAE
jgi:hypothetical protein